MRRVMTLLFLGATGCGDDLAPDGDAAVADGGDRDGAPGDGPPGGPDLLAEDGVISRPDGPIPDGGVLVHDGSAWCFPRTCQGKTYQCARRLPATTKVAITGTPLENTLMDLWSLLSITAPGLYPDPKRFSETYRKPIESGTSPELLGTLRRRIAPLMRRRTKDAVLTELPPKIEQTIEVELSSKQARIYATQLQRQRQKVQRADQQQRAPARLGPRVGEGRVCLGHRPEHLRGTGSAGNRS